MTSLLTYALPAACVVCVLWRYAFKSPLSHIPGPPSASWFQGNMEQLMSPNGWSFHRYISETFGAVVKFRSLFSKDALYISDPLALHYMLVKEMYVYEEPEHLRTMMQNSLGHNLLSSTTEQHKKQRKMLNPLFSIKHMRNIHSALRPVTNEITARLVKEVESAPKEVDMLKVMSRAALEYLGRGGLGETFGPLDNDHATAHSEAIASFTPTMMKTGQLQMIGYLFANIGTPAFRRRVLELLPNESIQKAIGIVDVLHTEAVSVVNKRKAALLKGENDPESLSQGHDILSVLLKSNMEAPEEDKLTEEEVIGQVNLFILAGQDTTSHAVSRILYELSHHPEVQSRLRDEIREARKAIDGDDFDYDTLNNLPYMDAICRETLRVHAPASIVHRVAQADTVLPLTFPIKSTKGESISEIPIKKGTTFMVSIFAANRNKKIWGYDADEWKPERWLNPLPSSVTDARLPSVYANMMTFIAGSRACIGFKFSEMEMKLVLSSLIEKLVFEPGPDIQWEMSGVARPVVVGTEDEVARLPLKVSLAQS